MLYFGLYRGTRFESRAFSGKTRGNLRYHSSTTVNWSWIYPGKPGNVGASAQTYIIGMLLSLLLIIVRVLR